MLVDGISAVSGSLRVVLLVAVQLVWIVGGHVGEVLENILVGFISCKNNKDTRHEQQQKEAKGRVVLSFVTQNYFSNSSSLLKKTFNNQTQSDFLVFYLLILFCPGE